MSQPLPPCDPKCPRRSWICHDRKICPEWGKYQDEMAAWRQMLQAAKREQDDFGAVRMKGPDGALQRRDS
ncbi:MAG: hypothetical protein IJ396_05605 [Oscillibacter sp.]|nr:hypothetical protein [Oscillibacter sp.]